jgi:cysteine synthase A
VAARKCDDGAVIAILPDRGDRYFSSIFSDAYMLEQGLTEEVAAPSPLQIGYGEGVARRWSFAALRHDGSMRYHDPEVKTSVQVTLELGLSGRGPER